MHALSIKSGCPVTEYLFASSKSRSAKEESGISKWQAPWLSHGGFLRSSYSWFLLYLCLICTKIVEEDRYHDYKVFDYNKFPCQNQLLLPTTTSNALVSLLDTKGDGTG